MGCLLKEDHSVNWKSFSHYMLVWFPSQLGKLQLVRVVFGVLVKSIQEHIPEKVYWSGQLSPCPQGDVQGCTKLKSAWGLNFKINFRPDFNAILCCLMVRPKMFILFWVIYIYIYICLKKNNSNNMNKEIIFWWSLWTMALIWYEYCMLVSALINCKVHTAKQFKSWKKGTWSKMLIKKENSSYKQLMSNLIWCNSCRKVGTHIVYVLLSKILIISFWRKHAYTAREIHMGQAVPTSTVCHRLVSLYISC